MKLPSRVKATLRRRGRATWGAVTLGLLALVFSGTFERRAWASDLRVLLSAASADSEDDALARRLSAEIKARGLAVVRAPAGTTRAQLPKLLTSELVAAVWVDARLRRTELWVGKSLRGGSQGHHVLTAESSSQMGVLALRTVESLRASLVDLGGELPASPTGTSSPAPMAAPTAGASNGPGNGASNGPATVPRNAPSNEPPTPPAPAAEATPARVIAPNDTTAEGSKDAKPKETTPKETTPKDTAVPEGVATETSPPAGGGTTERRPHLSVMAGVGAFVPAGTPGPWLGSSFRVAVLLPAQLFVGASAFLTWRDVTLRGTEGEASLSGRAGRLALGRRFDLARRLRLDAALGASLLRVAASGQAAAGFVGFSRSVLGVSADLELGLDVRLWGPLSLRVAVVAGWLVRRPVLQFDMRRVGEVGRAAATGLVGLEASF